MPRVTTTDEVSTPVSGKIQIDVVTPEMDNSRKEDPDYNAPGAFYLKSILIHFSDTIETVTEETFNFKDMYDNRVAGDGIFGDLTKITAKQIQFSQNDFDVTLEKVKKEATENIPDYAHTNGYIEVKLNKPGEEIFKVEFKIEYGTTSDSYKTLYGLYVSKSGGAPFKSLDITSDKTTCMLNASLFESNHINAIRLVPSKTNNIGLDYLKISTKAGINPTISSITPPAEFVPSVKEYSSGELFDTTGLGDLTISYEESGVEPDLLPASELEWFDGVSYDADAATATKELQAGTTYVCGIFRGKKVAEITGLTVVDIPISLTLVKNISDINTTDHYFIIEKDSKTLIKGSAAGDMGNKSKSGLNLRQYTFRALGVTGDIDIVLLGGQFHHIRRAVLMTARLGDLGLCRRRLAFPCADDQLHLVSTAPRTVRQTKLARYCSLREIAVTAAVHLHATKTVVRSRSVIHLAAVRQTVVRTAFRS